MSNIINNFRDRSKEISKLESKLVSDVLGEIYKFDKIDIEVDEMELTCSLVGDTRIEDGYIVYLYKDSDKSIYFDFKNSDDDYLTENYPLFNGSLLHVEEYIDILDYLIKKGIE